MIKESENYKEQDNFERNRIAARNALESYLFQVRTKIKEDPSVNKVLKQEEMDGVLKKVDEMEGWLEMNARSTRDEFERRKKEMEQLWEPLLLRVYASAQGASLNTG
ncbi:hypothetical protein MTO96_005520 [Rhipicephalus appendiculatus]